MVKTLRTVWGGDVYNHYGTTEMGLGGGVECAAHRGYHLREADLYFEIVDPLTGEHVEDGEFGEVVFTTLTREGMPLIRYRMGGPQPLSPGAMSLRDGAEDDGKSFGAIRWLRPGGKSVVYNCPNLTKLSLPSPGCWITPSRWQGVKKSRA